MTPDLARCPELLAFAEEAAATEQTLRDCSGADAGAPGIGEWTLGELVGHLVHLAAGVDRLARQGTREPPADIDRTSYYPAAALAGPPSTQPQPVEPAMWAQLFGEAWRTSARRFEELGPGAVLHSPFGTIRAVEYLATRVLEVVVHHIDVRAALDQPPVTTPAAGRITVALLESMLAGPRPRNFGRTRFVLAATGRIEVDDPRFPVLR